MKPSKALFDAYLHTVYRVSSEPRPVDIRIGENNAALDALLQANGVHQWAFVTASNPQSRPLPERDNARRNAEFRHELLQAGWRVIDGVGLPCGGGWQPEHSVLILGIDRDAASTLARQWRQKAIVYGTLGQPPELLWVS